MTVRCVTVTDSRVTMTGAPAQVRKGMVLVDERVKPKSSWEFDADIAILTHSTTIQPRSQVRAQSSG